MLIAKQNGTKVGLKCNQNSIMKSTVIIQNNRLIIKNHKFIQQNTQDKINLVSKKKIEGRIEKPLQHK